MRHETVFVVPLDAPLRIEAVSLARLAGLATGTRVATPEGEVPVEALRRGDRVLTRTGVKRVIVAEARAARVTPVRIAAQALGLRMPARDLVVGPATRLWLPRQSAPVDALHLVDGHFITQEEPKGILLWTLVFPTPQVVRMDGVEVCV